jgi:hypothetical protein
LEPAHFSYLVDFLGLQTASWYNGTYYRADDKPMGWWYAVLCRLPRRKAGEMIKYAYLAGAFYGVVTNFLQSLNIPAA